MIMRKSASAKSGVKMLWEYLAYAFAFAWGAELLIIAAYRLGLPSGGFGSFLHYTLIIIGPGLSPAYAAFIIQKKYEAVTFRDFCGRILFTGNLRKTAAVAAVFACIQFAACAAQESYRGNPAWDWLVYIPLMILGGGLEEIGWRGVLQPQLEKRLPFLIAAVMEGVLWSVWHLPLWLIPNTAQSTFNFLAFMLYTVALGCTLAAVYGLTKSIWASILIHAWGNTTLGGMYTFTSLIKLPSAKTIVICAVWIMLAAVIFKVCRGNSAQPEQRKTS